MTTLSQFVHANERRLDTEEGEELDRALLHVTHSLNALCDIRNSMKDRGQYELAAALNSHIDTIETVMDEISGLKDWENAE